MPEKQKLLLIGCGDLPSRLIQKLNLDDWDISGLRRSEIELNHVRMTYGDATDEQLIKDLLQQKPDQLILCLTPDSRNTEAYRNTYLKPAQLISNMANNWAPECHLVFVSSTSVYDQNSGEVVDEQSTTKPTRETAKALLEAENQIANSNNPFSIVRFSGIYGPGREHLINKIRSENFTASARTSWTNRIHSEDCAGVLAHLLTSFMNSKQGLGILIGTDSSPVLNIDLEKWLAEKLGVAAPADYDLPSKPAGKRCSNSKLLSEGFLLQYPEFQQGYQAMIETA